MSCRVTPINFTVIIQERKVEELLQIHDLLMMCSETLSLNKQATQINIIRLQRQNEELLEDKFKDSI